jgi:hypothetical protein
MCFGSPSLNQRKLKNHLLSKFIQFRFKQTGRLLKETGLILSCFILIVIGLILFSQLTKPLPEPRFLFVLFYLLILPIHFARKDDSFLRKLNLSKKIILATEYNILLFPFSLFLAYFHQWSIILLGHILVTCVIFIPVSTNRRTRSSTDKFVKWIPEYLFEWRSYFRQHPFFPFVCYILTLLFCFYTYTVPIGLLLLLSIIPNVFNSLESKDLIENYTENSDFLWSKIKDHSYFVHLFLLPLYLLFLVFHYQLWYVLVIFLFLIEFSICFSLLYKYSQFHVSRSNVHNQFPFVISFIAFLLFFPIGIFFIYLYWKKAQNALAVYAES